MSPALEMQPRRKLSRERFRVLVVEDDPIVRRLLRMCLYRVGLTVLTAESGEEAVAQTSDPAAEPVHLVITDGVMPGMDGFGVAEYFREIDPAIRVILISGYLNHFVSRPDIPENVDAFFDKPFAAEDVARKSLELLGVTA